MTSVFIPQEVSLPEGISNRQQKLAFKSGTFVKKVGKAITNLVFFFFFVLTKRVFVQFSCVFAPRTGISNQHFKLVQVTCLTLRIYLVGLSLSQQVHHRKNKSFSMFTHTVYIYIKKKHAFANDDIYRSFVQGKYSEMYVSLPLRT